MNGGISKNSRKEKEHKEMSTKGLIINSEKTSVISLYEFAQNALLQDENDIFSLKEEAIAAKSTIQDFNSVVERARIRFNKISNRADDDGNLSSEDEKKLDRLGLALLTFSETLQKCLLNVARIVKYATEVEAIKSSRLDGVQLLTILEQLPERMVNVLEKAITDIVSSINDTLDSELESTEQQRAMRKTLQHNNVLLNKYPEMRQVAINELVQSIVEEMQQKIQEISVVYNKDAFGKEASNQDFAVKEDEVNDIKRQVLKDVRIMQSSYPAASISDNSAAASDDNNSAAE